MREREMQKIFFRTPKGPWLAAFDGVLHPVPLIVAQNGWKFNMNRAFSNKLLDSECKVRSLLPVYKACLKRKRRDLS